MKKKKCPLDRKPCMVNDCVQWTRFAIDKTKDWYGWCNLK